MDRCRWPLTRAGVLAVLLAAPLGLSGCGAPVGQVKGHVTLKKQPMPGAELAFHSVAKAEDQFFGGAGADGVYHVSYRGNRGLPVGDYQVTVSWYTLPNGKPLPPGEDGQAIKNADGAVKHSAEFQKQVSSGANVIDFELTEGKKK